MSTISDAFKEVISRVEQRLDEKANKKLALVLDDVMQLPLDDMRKADIMAYILTTMDKHLIVVN